jgi:hypothetical protein
MSTDDLQAIINRITNKQYTEEDITLLQQLVTDNSEIALLQLDKYNVNIGEGKGIHIGDRITYQIVPQIKAILRQSQEELQPNHQEPAADKTFAMPTLEYPDGLVPLNSPFYIQYADIESLCYKTLINPGSLIRIKAPKLMGKTSLLIRIRYHAENQNYRAFYLDFGSVEKAVLSNLNTFLRWFCGKVSDEMNLNNKVKNVWNTDILSSNDNCTAYFNKHILAHINSPVVLILDEVDRLFLPENQELVVNFFGMLRSWHEKGKFNRDWEKLRLVLAHSTEAHIPLDIHQSPFNAGVPVELEEFNRQQVEDLAQRHQIKESNVLTEKLMSMVGGHPYLVRLAMYYIAAGKITLEDLLDSATTEAGIYSNHLRSLLDILQGKPKLAQALKKVVDSPVPVALDSIQIYQLHSLGLVQIQKNEVIPRCLLYREYFRRVLSGS